MVNTNSKGPSNKKRGRSKKAHVLAASVEQATENFLEKGDKIAKESQFLKEELVAAVEDVRKQGRSMPLFTWRESGFSRKIILEGDFAVSIFFLICCQLLK